MKRLIVMLIVLFLATLAHAAPQTSLLVTLTFLPDGSAQIDDVHVSFAGIDQQVARPLSDSLELIIEDKTYFATFIPVTFAQMDTIPLPTMTVSKHLPYFGNKGTLRVARNNKTLAEFDLSTLCNNDGRCQEFENGVSCHADCDVRSVDNICQPYSDTACDPDCAKGLDIDCERPLLPTRDVLTPIILLAGLVIAILVIYITSRRKK